MKDIIKTLKNKWHLFQSLTANIFYAFPQRKLKLIGVTGTDGKTTTAHMIYHILKSNGLNVSLLSTISARIGDKEVDTGFHVTTPDPWMVPKYLKMMVDNGAEYVVLEATSQGLYQNRLWGLTFEAGIITNIRSDHLDYHKSWEEYASAKIKLIELIREGGVIVLNEDDVKSFEFINKYLIEEEMEDLKKINFSKNNAKEIKLSFQGIEFIFEDQKFKLPIIGTYNIWNALAAINVCRKYLPIQKIAKALESFPAPEGRMQVLKTEPYRLIVDFAHTPNALDAALDSLKEIDNKSRIITVFGCAGLRDKGRREMGNVAARKSNLVILTAEDPRTESLGQINDDIISHASKSNGDLIKRFQIHNDFIVRDIKQLKQSIANCILNNSTPLIAFDYNEVASRQDAIKLSIELAEPGDLVYITGKAHEKSLAFGITEFPWSDVEEVKKILQ
jgi:UDP-N-acetylmuramoyl-L-alanyl-D-glutamate--2,6-diaminopimelate ligase